MVSSISGCCRKTYAGPTPLSRRLRLLLFTQNGADCERRGDLSIDQRKEYIKAVLCLQSRPPKAPKDKYPGVLNRYDDFVVTHMTLAGQLHSTV